MRARARWALSPCIAEPSGAYDCLLLLVVLTTISAFPTARSPWASEGLVHDLETSWNLHETRDRHCRRTASVQVDRLCRAELERDARRFTIGRAGAVARLSAVYCDQQESAAA